MPTKSLRNWLLFWSACLILGAAIVALWMHRAAQAREDLLARQRDALAGDRIALQQYWGEKVTWFPDPNALATLAVTPRSKFNDFDAMYVYFRGQHVPLVLTLTQVGGYINQARINAHQWPETLIERPLTPAERESLAELIPLLDQWIATLDSQSERRGWNEHVLKLTRDLAKAQGIAQPTSPTLGQTH